jgi:hypothetical protein
MQYPESFGNRTLGALKMIDPEGANDRVECSRIEV